MVHSCATRGRRSLRRISHMVALGLVALGAALLAAAVALSSAGATTGGAGLTAVTHATAPPRHHATTRRRRTIRRRTAHRRSTRPRAPRPANPLDGRAMWIWELPATDRGDLSAIVAGAHAHGVSTLIIKSSDGTSLWSQFTPALVAALHHARLQVCAWQYVYGNRPGVEANLGADAVRDGADCLIVDAESEYEGKYVAAQSYIHDLRRQIGARYPLALASFPYVDFHPAFPYSVFLGPGGAQFNVPQMYWRDIGESVDAVYAHTWAFNRIYGRAIFPLGQVYSDPPAHQIFRFRQLSKDYGAPGVSWWDWQEARAADWTAVSRPAGRLPGYTPDTLMAAVGRGASGDLVVWAQEHLVSAGEPSAIDGAFGARTQAAVKAFQAAHGLVVDGIVGPETWRALLRARPVHVTWVHHGRRTVAADARRADVARSDGGAALSLPVPSSASRPARRDEIPASLGAGRP